MAGVCHAPAAGGAGRRPHLVIVPLSTLPNWQSEFSRFTPQLNVVTLAGK